MINLIVLSLLAVMVIGLLIFVAIAVSMALSYIESIYRAKDDDEHD